MSILNSLKNTIPSKKGKLTTRSKLAAENVERYMS